MTVPSVDAQNLTTATGKRGVIASSGVLKPTFEQLSLPMYEQTGPWCWAYTSNSVIEYECARLTRRSLPLSTGFLAWAAQECDSLGMGGSNFGRASRGVNTFGVVPLSLYGEPPPRSPVPTPPKGVIDQGSNAFGVAFKWLRFWNREPVSDTQFQAIKEEIAAGHPVAVGMQWPKVTEFIPRTYVLPYPSPSGFVDGHCVVLCGFQDDPSYVGGGYFLFRNSWGKTWAKQGYAYMPYEMLRIYLNDAYSVRVTHRRSVPESAQRFAAADLLPGSNTKGAVLQKMDTYGKAWGERPQVFFRPEGASDELKLVLNIIDPHQYELFARFTTAEDYGRYEIRVNGTSSATVWDGASAGVSLVAPVSLGVFPLKAGANEVAFRFTGRSPASKGNCLGVHQLLLVRKQQE